MAEAAWTRCASGRERLLDYLGVSFSALDSVGPQIGPRSHEVQDLLARLDVTIGRLLDRLDARVGRGKYVVALSADHGVAVIPEQLKREGIDAGRAVMKPASGNAEAALVRAFGPGNSCAHGLHEPLFPARRVRSDRRAAGRLNVVMEAIRQTPGSTGDR